MSQPKEDFSLCDDLKAVQLICKMCSYLKKLTVLMIVIFIWKSFATCQETKPDELNQFCSKSFPFLFKP
jgi:hypothetical protein